MKHHFITRHVYTASPLLVVLAILGFSGHRALATSYLTAVRDLLTTSAPNALTSQTIIFTLAQAIPPNGVIDLDLAGGGFTIPAALNYTDVDVGFSAVAGGPYTQRPLSSVQTAGTDKVTVTSGAVGRVRIDLNTTVGIPAGNEVEVRIGTNASYGAIGDQRATLASATTSPRSFPIIITTYDAADSELDYGKTLIVVVPQVVAGPVDTTDQDPPIITFAQPTGILQVGTRGVELFLKTNERASCRYATSSMGYALMPYAFSGTTTGLVSWHFAQVLGLQDGTAYDYYVRCIDYRLNEIDPDYMLSFEVGIMPGSATTTSTSTTYGTGTGSSTASTTASSTGPGPGTDMGTGTGGSGSGSGSSASGGDSTGSGGGGSGGGGTGQGTKLPQADVRIAGWAYPGAAVTFLRDGAVVGVGTAGGSGEYSNLTTGLDRGAYTFAVYAADAAGVRSATFSTTLWLRAETLNTLANVMLPPTVSVAERSLEPGASLSVSGYSAPRADITVWLRPRLAEVSSGDVVATTSATGNGSWALAVPTDSLSKGTYELVAQAWMPGGMVQSDKSARVAIGLGVSVASGSCLSIGDLDCDGFVNLVDFSILLFNWNTSNAEADINSDGTVSLPDFSIMLYHWTG